MITAWGRMRSAEVRREQTRLADASARLRRLKIALGIALGVLFWFSVPYRIPEHNTLDNTAQALAENVQNFEGSQSRQLAVPLIGIVACYMLWRLKSRGKFEGRLLLLVIVYVACTAASFLWSDDPPLTAKRIVVFGIDALFAYALARTITAMEAALWALSATGVVGLLSLAVDLFVRHNFAPFDADYRFTGVMTANYQAMNLLVFCLSAAVLMLRRPHWTRWLMAALLAGATLLVLTRSRVAVILCGMLLLIVFARLARERMQPGARAAALLAMLLVALPTAVYFAGSDLSGNAQRAFMLGRNDTENTASLSNRLPLWQELLDSVATRPWLGFGYGAFWTPARVERVSNDQGWPVPHAHNTYLDQTISFGVIGGALYLVIMVSALVIAWRRYRAARSAENLFSALLLTWIVLLSTAESAPLEPHLPTLLAYATVLRMCVRQGSEAEQDDADAPIVQGLPERAVA